MGENSRLGGASALLVQRRVEFKGTVKVGCRGPLVLFRRGSGRMGRCALGREKVVEYVESSAKTLVSCRRYRKEYELT